MSDSYYGRPVLKEPVWKPEIPAYFFTGGLSGASAVLSLLARLSGRDRLARATLLTGAAADAASPLLLIRDLGRPERFLNMLRVVKPTSPMSVGSWILLGSGTASGGAAMLNLARRAPRLELAAESVAAALGPALSTYTAALVANTAVPVWHEARDDLPAVFAASSLASAGAAGTLLAPPEEAGPARRFAVGGVAAGLLAERRMHVRLGPFLAEPYRTGRAGLLTRAARAGALAGAALVAAGGRRRPGVARTGAALVLASELTLRFAVMEAGRQSARDPRYTVEPQRERLAGAAT